MGWRITFPGPPNSGRGLRPTGSKEQDRDIICRCDYRDPDLSEHDTCHCALYVSPDVVDGKKMAVCIPERSPDERSSLAQSPPRGRA